MNEAAAALGMPLGADKSAVMSFEEGFCFLGEDFGPRYPPALADHRVIEPPRRVLYVGMQGAHARLEAGRVIVESPDDTELLDVPSGTVERIVCFGAAGISAGLRSWALVHEVDLVFLSRRGSYLGHALAAAGQHRIARLRAQLAAADDTARAVAFGRAVVDAKVRKQMILLQRLARRGNAEAVTDAVRQMDQLLAMLPDCGTRDELMGIEGAAARAYFSALGHVLPEGMTFAGRSRQPPEDVINAALSYGYAIILSEAVSALCAAGLDPAIGMLHAEQDRRPSLALDLMEEFRPLVVDQVVISAARRAELRPEHGHREESVHGVLLTKAGREVLLGGYERRMLQHTKGALPGLSGSLRRHLYRQAERLAAYITTPPPPGPACHGADPRHHLRHQRRPPPLPGRRHPASLRRPHPAQRLHLHAGSGPARRGPHPDRRYHQPGHRLGVRLPPVRCMLGAVGIHGQASADQRTAVLGSPLRGGG